MSSSLLQLPLLGPGRAVGRCTDRLIISYMSKCSELQAQVLRPRSKVCARRQLQPERRLLTGTGGGAQHCQCTRFGRDGGGGAAVAATVAHIRGQKKGAATPPY